MLNAAIWRTRSAAIGATTRPTTMPDARNFVTVWNMSTRIVDESAEPAVYGFLEVPEQSNGDGIALAHGAGSNCQAKLLIEVSEALGAHGFTVLRFDLPFRVARPTGPPAEPTLGTRRPRVRSTRAAMGRMKRIQLPVRWPACRDRTGAAPSSCVR